MSLCSRSSQYMISLLNKLSWWTAVLSPVPASSIRLSAYSVVKLSFRFCESAWLKKFSAIPTLFSMKLSMSVLKIFSNKVWMRFEKPVKITLLGPKDRWIHCALQQSYLSMMWGSKFLVFNGVRLSRKIYISSTTLNFRWLFTKMSLPGLCPLH